MVRPLFICCAIWLLCTHTANAQVCPRSNRQVFAYCNTGLSFGIPLGFKFSIAALFATHHELSIGYNGYQKKARQTPGDYVPGQGLFALSDYPLDDWSGAVFTYGYVIYPRGHPKLRFVLRAGAGTGMLITAEQFYPTYNGFNLFGPPNPPPTPGYYGYELVHRPRTAFVLQPSLDASPARAFAGSFGFYAIFCDGMTGGGISTSILFGKVSNVRRAISPDKLEWRRHRKFQRAKRWAESD